MIRFFLIKVSSQLKQMFDDLEIDEIDLSNEADDDASNDDDEDQYSKDKPKDDDYED